LWQWHKCIVPLIFWWPAVTLLQGIRPSKGLYATDAGAAAALAAAASFSAACTTARTPGTDEQSPRLNADGLGPELANQLSGANICGHGHGDSVSARGNGSCTDHGNALGGFSHDADDCGESDEPDDMASKALEARHVHDVYDAIASHFSSTR
jgi:hypothetical protein